MSSRARPSLADLLNPAPVHSRIDIANLLNPVPNVQASRLSVASLLNPIGNSPPPELVLVLPTDSRIIHTDYKLTNRTTLKFVYEHALGSVVEYPTTGKTGEEAIGHLFHESWSNPANDFAYSRGSPHGYYRGTWEVPLLVDKDTGQPVPCSVKRSTCSSILNAPFFVIQNCSKVKVSKSVPSMIGKRTTYTTMPPPENCREDCSVSMNRRLSSVLLFSMSSNTHLHFLLHFVAQAVLQLLYLVRRRSRCHAFSTRLSHPRESM